MGRSRDAKVRNARNTSNYHEKYIESFPLINVGVSEERPSRFSDRMVCCIVRTLDMWGVKNRK